MEDTGIQKESEKFFVMKKLIELKTVISGIECRMNEFEDSRQTMLTAKDSAEKCEFSGTVSFLSKEVIKVCFKEFNYWIIKGDVEKAIKAHLSAAIIFSSCNKNIAADDLIYFQNRIFTSGIPKLWEIGTYHHRQGNAYLLAGSPSYNIAKEWEVAIKCYSNVQKLHEIGSSLGAAVPENYFKQAQIQIQDIGLAKSRLNYSS